MSSTLSRTVVTMAMVVGLAACSNGPAAPPPAASAPAAEQAAAAPESGVQLSALAPENIAKSRSKPPFDLTGNWFIDVSENPEAWRFGPPYPKLTAAAQVHFEASQKA